MDITSYIHTYGYLAIFFIIFVQELNIPLFIPVELAIFMLGYLSYQGVINLPAAMAVAVVADFSGTACLYALFYLFGKLLIAHPPRWLPVKTERIRQLSNSISKRGKWGIYVGRLIPYLRTPVSAAAGLLEITPAVYLPLMLVASLTWVMVLALLGYMLAPTLGADFFYFSTTSLIILTVISVILMIVILWRIFKTSSSAKNP